MYLIAIEGPSASGKSTLAKHIQTTLLLHFKVGPTNNVKVGIVNVDRFYRNSVSNYDIPDAFDKELLFETVRLIKEKKTVQLPRYSYIHHKRLPETDTLEPCDVVILEGILVYHWPELRAIVDLPIYLDVRQEECLIRRVKRDVIERGRTVNSVFDQYFKTVLPAFETFIKPLKKIISEAGGIVTSDSNGISLTRSQLVQLVAAPDRVSIDPDRVSIDPDRVSIDPDLGQ